MARRQSAAGQHGIDRAIHPSPADAFSTTRAAGKGPVHQTLVAVHRDDEAAADLIASPLAESIAGHGVAAMSNSSNSASSRASISSSASVVDCGSVALLPQRLPIQLDPAARDLHPAQAAGFQLVCEVRARSGAGDAKVDVLMDEYRFVAAIAGCDQMQAVVELCREIALLVSGLQLAAPA
jgi:hypothetical protein